jgi:hypothetical protein
MPPAGFEPALTKSERPQPDRATNGIGYNKLLAIKHVFQNVWVNSCIIFIVHEIGKKEQMGSTCRKYGRDFLSQNQKAYIHL